MRVPVTDLVGQPGATRPLTAAVDRDELGDEPLGPAEGALAGPIDLDLDLDAVVEGILVRGTVTARFELPCARCLETQAVDRAVAVAELFVDPRRRDDGHAERGGGAGRQVQGSGDDDYEIVDDLTAIDLSTMLRDTILVDLPLRVLCRDDCAGLCPICGVNRNNGDCGHDREAPATDPRWARLAEIDVPPA